MVGRKLLGGVAVPRIKIHYGWVICFGCTLLLCCTMGLVSNVFTVCLPYIISENGFTKTQGSSITTARCLFAFLTMLFTDRFYRKINIRLGVTLSCLSVASGYAVYACARSLFTYYCGAALCGLGYGLSLIHIWSMTLLQKTELGTLSGLLTTMPTSSSWWKNSSAI